jgi:hypothetical protein
MREHLNSEILNPDYLRIIVDRLCIMNIGGDTPTVTMKGECPKGDTSNTTQRESGNACSWKR